MKTINDFRLSIISTCDQQLKTTSSGRLLMLALDVAPDQYAAGESLADLFVQIAGNVSQSIAGELDELRIRLEAIATELRDIEADSATVSGLYFANKLIDIAETL